MKRALISLIFVAAVSFLSASDAFAQYSSSNYKTEETFFGAGGELESSSANYKGQSSIGNLGVGRNISANYQAFSGFLTPNEPFLEMTVNTSLVDLGVLDSTSTKTGNSTFTVRAYTNSGYTVATVSNPPQTSTGVTLSPMTSQGASAVGTEQFGINLRANTSPATFGADPTLQPDSSFADGQAASGYSTVNQYKYNAGDVIAQTSASGWGQTTYTISYIGNITGITRAGAYSMVHDLVVVPTY